MNLRGLHRNLLFEQFARALDRKPLAQRHRAGAREQPGDPGDDDLAREQVRARDAHHEAEVRQQSVIGAQHRSAKRVAGRGSMAPLEARDERAVGAAVAGDRPKAPRMPAFLAVHPGGPVGNRRVLPRVRLFLVGDDRENHAGAEPAPERHQRASPPTDAEGRHLHAGGVELRAPVLGVPPLGGRQPAIHLGEPRVGFDAGQGIVERGGVQLVLNEGDGLARRGLGRSHGSR